ncbi:MAG: AI-2E family transporter, partial [Acidimicrobiia bacterium]
MADDTLADPVRPSHEISTREDADSDRWPPISYWAKVSVVVLLVILGFGLVWLHRSVALVFVASLVLAIGLQPSIRWFERRGMGRGWALAATLFAGLVVLLGFAAVLIPFLVGQVSALVDEFPAFVERLRQT